MTNKREKMVIDTNQILKITKGFLWYNSPFSVAKSFVARKLSLFIASRNGFLLKLREDTRNVQQDLYRAEMVCVLQMQTIVQSHPYSYFQKIQL
jgi:hypothetical protein